MRKYINENHKAYSEACEAEIAEMAKHPMTAEKKEAQMRRNRQLSTQRATKQKTR